MNKLWTTEKPWKQAVIGLIIVFFTSSSLIRDEFSWTNMFFLLLGAAIAILMARSTTQRFQLEKRVNKYLSDNGFFRTFETTPLFDENKKLIGVARGLKTFSINGEDRFCVTSEAIGEVVTFTFTFSRREPIDPWDFILVYDSNPGGSSRYSAYVK